MCTAVSSALRLNAEDNAVVAVTALEKNQEIKIENVICRAPVPQGHKVATRAIAKGETIRKYDGEFAPWMLGATF